jgi:hypothetical protein
MLYRSRLHGYAPNARGLLSGSAEWIILRMAHKKKLANRLSYSEHWINFYVVYYPSCLHIMQEYHDSSRMCDFGMAQYLHRAMAKLPRQRRCQHDSAYTLCHGEVTRAESSLVTR